MANDVTSTPASDLLYDRLRARREESKLTSKSRRRRQTDFGPVRPDHDDLFLAEAQESGMMSATLPRKETTLRSSSQNSELHHGPGMRHLDQQIDKLTKLNFDLKMEVYHRRQREDKLMEKINAMIGQLRRAEKVQEEHAQLWAINDSLVKELEQRDYAIKEAVDMILKLENDNEALQLKFTSDKPASITPISTPKLIPATPGPEQTISRPHAPLSQASAAALPRLPKSLEDQGHGGNQALRNAYLDSTQNLRTVKSFLSMLSEHESRDGTCTPRDVHTPRLSLLSDFGSLHANGAMNNQDASQVATDYNDADREDVEPPVSLSPRQDSIKRVSKWMTAADYASAQPPPQIGKLPDTIPRNIDTVLSTATPEQLFHGSFTLNPPAHAQRSHGPQIHAERPSTSTTITGDSDKAWYEGAGSISTGTPSRFQTSRSEVHSAKVTYNSIRFDIPAVSTPSTRRPATAPAAKARSSQAHVETYIPRGMNTDKFPASGSVMTTGSPPRHVVTIDQASSTSPASSKKSTRSSLAQRTQRLFRRSSDSHHTESPSSTRSSYLSETTSSARHRPSTTATSLSSSHNASSRECLRQQAGQSFLDVAPPAAGRGPLMRSDSHYSSRLCYQSDAVDESTSLDEASLQPPKRISGVSSVSGAPSPAKQVISAPSDLSRNGARAAWDGGSSPVPASGLTRSTSNRGHVGKLLGFERRMSRA